MNHMYRLWRLKNGHWRIVKWVDSLNYPCCASRERVLGMGERPRKFKLIPDDYNS